MPAFTVTNTYFATGEGVTSWLMYVYAEDEKAALEAFKRKTDAYFSIGAEVRRGLDLECDAAKLLLTDGAKAMLAAKDYGNAVYFAELHLNYS